MSTSPNTCKPPGSFFVAIPPGWMERVSIPKSFMQYLKEITKNSIIILRRDDQEWQVKLVDWVFAEGWENFLTDNGVEDRGNIVIFNYDGGRVFDTSVFDMSLCELQYPTHQVTKAKKILKKKDTSTIRNSSSSKLEIGKNSIISDADTEMETETKTETESDTETETEMGTEIWTETNTDLAGPSNTTLGLGVNHHPHFTGTLKSDSEYVLYLPGIFVRVGGLKVGMITLMNGENKEWMVNLARYENAHRLGEGWNIFYRANGLRKGDHFKLEFVSTGNVPKAMFHRLSQAPQKCFFRSTATANCITASRVNVPNSFAIPNRLVDRNCKMIMIDENGKQWPMKLTYPDIRVRIIRTREMMLANGVREGDDFLIELVDNRDTPVMRFRRGSTTNPLTLSGTQVRFHSVTPRAKADPGLLPPKGA